MLSEQAVSPGDAPNGGLAGDDDRAGGIGVLVEGGEDVETLTDPYRTAQRVVGGHRDGDLAPGRRCAAEHIERDEPTAPQWTADHATLRRTVRRECQTPECPAGTADLHDRQVLTTEDVTRLQISGCGVDARRGRWRRGEAEPDQQRQRGEHDAGDDATVERDMAPPPQRGPRTHSATAEPPRAEPATGTLVDGTTRRSLHPAAIEVSEPMADDLPPPLLKPADVARVLNVTVTQVYTLMRSGDLPALKIGRKGVWRVSHDTLDEYLARLEAEARSRAPVTDPALD